MNVIGKKRLEKLKRKNHGNSSLHAAIDELLHQLESKKWSNQTDIVRDRPDADCVHSDGFYFFNIHVHRTMVLIEFEEHGEATIVWCGSHDEYEIIFKHNKNTVKKWLKTNEWIS
jgi:mRNA interferase HigB